MCNIYGSQELRRNLVGSIFVTCRSKIAKIVLIGKPRWQPWPPIWKFILRFYSWTERPTDSKLGNSQNRSNQKSKMAIMAAILKIYLLFWTERRTDSNLVRKYRDFFSWTERPADSRKLSRKYRVNLQIKISKKSFRLEIQNGRHVRHLENLFCASPPELKGKLTHNLLESIETTCR